MMKYIDSMPHKGIVGDVDTDFTSAHPRVLLG